jgi:1,4-alpha-glucan branching enzyme
MQKLKSASVQNVPFAVTVPGANEVIVTGDFTEWSTEGVRLASDGDDRWRTTLALAPGEYEYRLIVDGEWRDDPDAPVRRPNPFGTRNCVLVVPRR